MPFEKKDKILFVHIPKTGGTSIEHFFNLCHPEKFWFGHWDRDQLEFLAKYEHLTSSKKILYEPQHYTLEILKKLMDDYEEYFKFTFVRNPYTKLLSEYFWTKNIVLNCPSEFDPQDFHQWCELFLSELNSSHKEPQVNYIDETIDFIGWFEHLQRDFEDLIEILASRFNNRFKNYNLMLPVQNSTSLEKYQLIHLLLRETKELIVSTYEEDFFVLNYDRMLY